MNTDEKQDEEYFPAQGTTARKTNREFKKTQSRREIEKTESATKNSKITKGFFVIFDTN